MNVLLCVVRLPEGPEVGLFEDQEIQQKRNRSFELFLIPVTGTKKFL